MQKIVILILAALMLAGLTAAELPHEGDRVYILVETGESQERAYGNVTGITDNLICLACEGIESSSPLGASWTKVNRTYPLNLCVGTARISTLFWL